MVIYLNKCGEECMVKNKERHPETIPQTIGGTTPYLYFL